MADLGETLRDIEQNFDPSKSKLTKAIGKACVIIGFGLPFFMAGYGIGKIADYTCKKLTNKQIYEHFQKIYLPTEPRLDYRNSISNGKE